MFVWYGALQRQHIMYMHTIASHSKTFPHERHSTFTSAHTHTHTHGKETDTHIRTLDETHGRADENQSQAKPSQSQSQNEAQAKRANGKEKTMHTVNEKSIRYTK